MKKYLLLSLLISIMILFAGCPHKTEKPKEETTVLTIKNQTSFSIKDIKYSDQTVSLLQAGSSSSVQLAEKATGYLYFTVYDETKNVSFSVRANDTIIVEKGKTQIFNITDNTLVIQTGQTQPIKILNLMNAAVLKIYNETSWDIVEINYGGKIHKETIVSGKEWKTEFGDTMQHELKLTVLKKKDNTTVSFTLKDIVAIELGKTKEVHIKNATLAVQEGKTEPEEIRHLLGGCTLTVINECSADNILDISYGGVVHTASVKQNASCKLELQESIDDYLIFYVKAKYVTFKVKTDAKITVKSKEEKTITIDNTMDVIVLALKYDDGETPTEGDDLTKVLKLQKVVDAALLDITNKSSAELLNVTYDKCNAGVIDAYDGTAEEEPWVQFDCWDFPTTATHITFDIKLPEKLIKLKTVEPIVLANSDKTKFTFTNKTKVINVETGITTTIGKVIGLSSLTVINKTAAKLSDIQYAGHKTDKSFVLSQNEKWEGEFNKSVQDYLTFKIRNKLVTVKTVDKISINSGEEKIFNITDDTAVIPSEAQEPTTVYKVLHAATLEISNGSSVKLYNVKYGDRNFGDLTIESEGDSINALNYWDITNTALPISFELQTSKKKVKVKTEEMIKLNENDELDFTIKDTTRVIVEKTGKSTSISKIGSKTTSLKIINQSTAKSISNIHFAGMMYNEGILKGNGCDFEFDTEVEDYIYFNLENSFATYFVRTKDKIKITEGEEKSFNISNYIEIIVEGTDEITSIQKILEKNSLKIINQSTAKSISQVSFAGKMYNFTLPKDSTCNFEFDSITEDYIYFVVENEFGTYNAKTRDKVLLTTGEGKTFIINDDTHIIIQTNDTHLIIGNTYPTKISSIINAAALKVRKDYFYEVHSLTYDGPIPIELGSFPHRGNHDPVTFIVLYDTLGCDTQEEHTFSFKLERIRHHSYSIKIEVKTLAKFALMSKETISFVITGNTPIMVKNTGEVTTVENLK